MESTYPESYVVPTPLMRALADYLVTQPYNEVWQMVEALRQCKGSDPPAEKPPLTTKPSPPDA